MEHAPAEKSAVSDAAAHITPETATRQAGADMVRAGPDADTIEPAQTHQGPAAIHVELGRPAERRQHQHQHPHPDADPNSPTSSSDPDSPTSPSDRNSPTSSYDDDDDDLKAIERGVDGDEDKRFPPRRGAKKATSDLLRTDERDGTLVRPLTNNTTASSYIAPKLSLPHEIIFVAVCCAAQLCTQAGLAQTLSIIHVIGDHFGVSSPGNLSWLIAAYSLTVGSFILVSGRLGDLYGHKRMIVIGYCWFAVWSLVAGLSAYSGYYLFALARALQGIGPSILLPNGLAVLGSSYPPGHRKHMVFSLFGAAAPTGFVLGATFSALLAQLAWWPWAFFVFAIVLAVLAVLAHVAIPANVSAGRSTARNLREVLSEMDLLGAVIGIAALFLVNVAWNQAPLVGWQSPYVIVLLILGVGLLPVFGYVELRVARFPLLPLEALKSPSVGFVLACLGCGWGCFGVFIYYLWQIFVVIRQASPLLASAWMSPCALAGTAAAITTGYMLSRAGPAWTMVVAMSAFLAGACLAATLPVSQSYWAQAFLCAIIPPWGMDMSFPAGTVILSNVVSKRHQGVAASLVNTVVNYSISLGLGVASVAEVHAGGPAGATRPGDIIRGYRAALYVAIGLSGAGWVLSLVFLAYERLTKGKKPGRDNEEGVGMGKGEVMGVGVGAGPAAAADLSEDKVARG